MKEIDNIKKMMEELSISQIEQSAKPVVARLCSFLSLIK